MTKREVKNIVPVLTFLLVYFRFFRPIGISDEIWKVINYSFLFSFAIISQKKFLKNFKKDYFGKYIKVFFISISLSVLTAFAGWDQSIQNTLLSSLPYFSFIFYFYLIYLNPNSYELEKAVQIFSVLFLLSFYLALIIYPNRLFLGYGELDKEINISRGLPRIRLTLIGASPIFFSFFYMLNKLRKTWNWQVFFIVLFLYISIILQLGRQSIMYTSILGTLLFIHDSNILKKAKILFFSTIAIASILYLTPVFSNLLEKSETEYETHINGNENVRVGAYKFYTYEGQKHTLAFITGNGMYSLGKSTYGDYINFYGRFRGYIPADVGFAAIFFFFGILGILTFLAILRRVYLAKIPTRFLYLKYYVYFLYLSNIAGFALLGTIPLLVISLYLIAKKTSVN